MGAAIAGGVVLLAALVGLLLRLRHTQRQLTLEIARRRQARAEVDEARNAIAYLQVLLEQRLQQLRVAGHHFEQMHRLFLWALDHYNPKMAEQLRVDHARAATALELRRMRELWRRE